MKVYKPIRYGNTAKKDDIQLETNWVGCDFNMSGYSYNFMYPFDYACSSSRDDEKYSKWPYVDPDQLGLWPDIEDEFDGVDLSDIDPDYIGITDNKEVLTPPPIPKCDCGGEKSKMPCYDWCTLKKINS